MSPSTAFFLGIFAGFMIVLITAWRAVTWFRDDIQRLTAVLSGLLRGFSSTTGYRSVLVGFDDERVVVSIEQFALSLEGGRLLTHAPVRTHSSDRPPPLPYRRRPPEEPPDGRA